MIDEIKAIIERFPDVKPHLKGSAAFLAGLPIKTGEAPDDDRRRKDEKRIMRIMERVLAAQYERILKEAERMRNG